MKMYFKTLKTTQYHACRRQFPLTAKQRKNAKQINDYSTKWEKNISIEDIQSYFA